MRVCSRVDRSMTDAAHPLPRSKPPFRADHVGSLLRPQVVLDARSKFESKQISAAELRRIEDDAIRYVVKRQEEVGLRCVTDGELRRGTWHMDFLCRIGGVTAAGTQVRPFSERKWRGSQ